MLRLLKWIMVSVFSFIAIALIGITWFVSTTDPNDYKGYLVSLAQQQDIDIQINGDLSWQLIPQLGISIADTELSLPKQGIEQLKIQQLTLSLDKSQLLQRRIVFQTLDIAGATVVAHSIADAGKVIAAPSVLQGSPSTKSSQTLPFALEIQQFHLTDANITIADRDGDLTFNNLNLAIENPDLQQLIIPLQLSFNTDLDDSTPIALDLNALITVKTGTANNSLEELLKQARNSSTSNLRIQLSETTLGIEYGEYPIQLTLDGEYQQQTDQLTLNNFTLALHNLAVTGDAAISNLLTQPSAKGAIQIPTFQLPQLLGQLNQDSGTAVQTLAASSNFEATQKRIALNELKITADQQTLSGHFSLTQTPLKNLELILKGDTLGLPEQPATDSTHQNSTSGEALLTPLLAPLALLDGGKGHIELTLKQLNLAGYSSNNLHLNLFSNGKVIRLSDLSGKVFDGNFHTDARIDLRPQIPTLTFNQQLTGIDLQQALSQLADYSDLSGKLTLNFSGKSQGNKLEALKINASGSGKLLINQPTLSNFNLEKSLCEIVSLVAKRSAATAEFTGSNTQFTDINSDLSLQKGVARLSNLRTTTGNITLSANGGLDTLKEQVNLLLATNIQGERTSKNGCSVNKRLQNIDIPVRCTGPLKGDLSCQPDSLFIEQLLKKALFDEVTRQLIKGKAEDKKTTDQEPSRQNLPKQEKSDLEKAKEAIDLIRGILNQ